MRHLHPADYDKHLIMRVVEFSTLEGPGAARRGLGPPGGRGAVSLLGLGVLRGGGCYGGRPDGPSRLRLAVLGVFEPRRPPGRAGPVVPRAALAGAGPPLARLGRGLLRLPERALPAGARRLGGRNPGRLPDARGRRHGIHAARGRASSAWVGPAERWKASTPGRARPPRLDPAPGRPRLPGTSLGRA